MHQKHTKDGLVIVSVSTDAIDEDNPKDKVVQSVRDFLKRFKAPFGAVILDEPQEVVEKKLRFQVAPCAFVFDRKGKWTQIHGGPGFVEKVEKTVVDLLKEK